MKNYFGSMVLGWVLTGLAQKGARRFLKRDLNQTEVMVATGVLSLVLSAVAKRSRR